MSTSEQPPAPPPPSNGSGSGLRGPQGCAEWTVVVLGVIWIVLGLVFVIALIARLS